MFRTRGLAPNRPSIKNSKTSEREGALVYRFTKYQGDPTTQPARNARGLGHNGSGTAAGIRVRSAASQARAVWDPSARTPAPAKEPGMAQLERSAISGFSSKSRRNSFAYDVKREVYNEETFQQEHKRKASSSGNMNINITTFRHHVQCRCSWHRFLRCVLTIFPFLEWMCMYRLKDWLLGDLLAGISVGL
ncbi:solute carrier family 26 member 8, partial [Homo sapiens]